MPPAAMPATMSTGICITAGRFSFTPSIVTTMAETIYCPSAPILNRLVLNANATERPVSIIGVAFIMTFEIYFGLANMPLKSAPNACHGL